MHSLDTVIIVPWDEHEHIAINCNRIRRSPCIVQYSELIFAVDSRRHGLGLVGIGGINQLQAFRRCHKHVRDSIHQEMSRIVCSLKCRETILAIRGHASCSSRTVISWTLDSKIEVEKLNPVRVTSTHSTVHDSVDLEGVDTLSAT
jgi:hypothetical protein